MSGLSGKTGHFFAHSGTVEAMTLADEVVLVNSGIIEQVGSSLALYDHPASLFGAAFIGSPPMNFPEGDLTRSERSSPGCDGFERMRRRSNPGEPPAQKGMKGAG
jgi:ABC-type sugar transport system ATPase subunit